MLLYDNKNQIVDVVFANQNTVCYMCQKELTEQNQGKPIDEYNSVIAKKLLAGKLYGQRVLRVGQDKFICLKHLKEAVKLIEPDSVEQTKTPAKTASKKKASDNNNGQEAK